MQAVQHGIPCCDCGADTFGKEEDSVVIGAEEVGFSPNHFSTVFSQETGQTFVEYLTAVRIEAAKHLLTKGNSRMSDIVFDVGYQDSHYFSYLFKKHVGVSPREYRSRLEEGQNNIVRNSPFRNGLLEW